MEGNKDLTQESAEILCVRGITPVENGKKSTVRTYMLHYKIALISFSLT